MRLNTFTLLEGIKWYGMHLGPYPTPSREDDPRHMPPNFYYDQQDLLGRACGASTLELVGLTAVLYLRLRSPTAPEISLRCSAPTRRSAGSSIRRWTFPAAPPVIFLCFPNYRTQPVWPKRSFLSPRMKRDRNAAFNVTNGDSFRWCQVWPLLAQVVRHSLRRAAPHEACNMDGRQGAGVGQDRGAAWVGIALA